MNQSLEAANISPMQAEDGVNGERPTPLLRGGWRDYLAIARFDHTTKHVFIIPGIILAYALRPSLQPAATSIIVGFGSAVAIASANYVINDWLDREFAAFHPQKSTRTAVNRSLRSEKHTSELQSLMRISYAVFCLKKKKKTINT